MVENQARTLVVFLTMHRSGSSVATSVFHRLGMSLGPFELLESAPSNPHGHFEALPILDLNKDVQRFIYGFDEDLPESEQAIDGFVARRGNFDWPAIPADFLARGRALIERLISSATISGFKDPRTALLWPFWKRVLDGFPDLCVAPVALLRSPHAIAMSLCSRNLTTGAIYGYWDCLDMVAIHYSLMKRILDDCATKAPYVRFGLREFLGDLEQAVQQCGLVWDASIANEMIENSFVHHRAARVRHLAQELYDDLCGECSLFDVEANLAHLTTDSRLCERLAWRRLGRAQRNLQTAHGLIGSAQIELSQAREQRDQACAQLDRTRDQLDEDRRQLLEAQQQLTAAHAEITSSQEHAATLTDLVGRLNAALELSRLEIQTLQQLCDAQQQKIAKFEDHPVLGAALKGRRKLRSAFETLRSTRAR